MNQIFQNCQNQAPSATPPSSSSGTPSTTPLTSISSSGTYSSGISSSSSGGVALDVQDELDQLKIDFKSFKCKFEDKRPHWIGEGSFSKVYSGTYHGYTVAVKRLKFNDVDLVKMSPEEKMRQIRRIQLETALMLRCGVHPHIVQVMACHAVLSEEERPMLVLEHMETTLFMALHKKELHSMKQRYDLLRGIAEALEFLHLQGIVHSDIKSLNILLNADLSIAKLSDFGEAKEKGFGTTVAMSTNMKTGGTSGGDGGLATASGTVCYQPPEMLLQQVTAASRKADIHAFGVVLWECLSGEVPHAGNGLLQILLLAQDAGRDTLLEVPTSPNESLQASDMKAWNVLQSLSSKCLQRDRSSRPTASDLVQSWPASVDESLYEDAAYQDLLQHLQTQLNAPNNDEQKNQSASKPSRRQQIAVVVAVAVLVAIGIAVWASQPASPTETFAPTPDPIPPTTPGPTPRPTDQPTSGPTEFVLRYDPPLPSDCLAVANGEPTSDEGVLLRNFQVPLDVVLTEEKDGDETAQELEDPIRRLLMPELLGCDKPLDKETNYVISNAVVNVKAKGGVCARSEKIPCLPVLCTIDLSLKGPEHLLTLMELINVVFGYDQDLVNKLQMTSPYEEILLVTIEVGTPTEAPSEMPSFAPSESPSNVPSLVPSASPSSNPTNTVTRRPTPPPTPRPTPPTPPPTRPCFQSYEELHFNVGNWFDSSKAVVEGKYGPMADWCFGPGVTRMSFLFDGRTTFNEPIGGWDVSGVTNMYQMFHDARSFDQDIGSWNVGSVRNMYKMFWNAEAFNQDIGGWDVSSVTDMYAIFQKATAFDQNLCAWGERLPNDGYDTYMFKDASSCPAVPNQWP